MCNIETNFLFEFFLNALLSVGVFSFVLNPENYPI